MIRVCFLGQSGPYAPHALEHLLASQGAYEIALVVQGLTARSSGCSPVQRFRAACAARPGLSAGEGLSDLAARGGVALLQTSDINGQGAVRVLEDHALDLLVCVGFDRLFRRPVLAAAKKGGINAHPSRLPEFRGPSPLFWMLKAGLREAAVTLHALDAKEDHGQIYAQEPFLLRPRATGAELYQIAGTLAGQMLASLLDQAACGSLIGLPQDHAKASRAPRPSPEAARIDPGQWDCEPLVNFASGAAYFRAVWMRLGEETFFLRRGLWAKKGRRIPAQYVHQGETLVLQCRDGLAGVEVQV